MVWALLLGVLSLAHTTRAVQEAWSSQPSTLQISSQGGNDDCALHLGPLFAAPQWREERASADAWAQADAPTTSQDSDEAYIAEWVVINYSASQVRNWDEACVIWAAARRP